MVSIAELKTVERAHQWVLQALKYKPLSLFDVGYSSYSDLRELPALGLVESAVINVDYWYWLTDAGFRKIGYFTPEDYGDPTCEACDGRGHELPWEPGEEQEDCWTCHGSGVDVYEADDLIQLDE